MDQYINDGLHEFIGMSDMALVEYIKSSATQAKDRAALEQDLYNLDFPSTPRFQAFVDRLMSSNLQ